MKKMKDYALDFDRAHPVALLEAAANIAALVYEGWEVCPTSMDENLFWYDPERKIIHVPTTAPFSVLQGLEDVIGHIFK